MRVASAPSTPLMRRCPSWAGILREERRPCSAPRGMPRATIELRVKSCVASTLAIASRSIRGGASLLFQAHQRCCRLVAIVAGFSPGTCCPLREKVVGVTRRTSHAVSSSRPARSSHDSCATICPSIAMSVASSSVPAPMRITPPHDSQASSVSIRRSSRKRTSMPNIDSDWLSSPSEYGFTPPEPWTGRCANVGDWVARAGLTPGGRSSTAASAAWSRRGVAGTPFGASKRT